MCTLWVPVSEHVYQCVSTNDCICVHVIVFLSCFVLAGIICGEKKNTRWCQACPMLSVWVAAGRGWVLHVLPGCGRLWLAIILLPSHVVFRAGAAQQGAAQDRQTGRRPAHKQGRAELIPVRERGFEKVVKRQAYTVCLFCCLAVFTYLEKLLLIATNKTCWNSKHLYPKKYPPISKTVGCNRRNDNLNQSINQSINQSLFV